MIKKVNEKNKEDKGNRRGWEALEIMLQERGITGSELEEARDSFYKGIELLSRLFLSQFILEKHK